MMQSKTRLAGLILPALLVPTLAFPAHQARWADVLEAKPLTRTVRTPVDQEVCWDEEVYEPIRQRRSATPLIIGAILGGVVGNQFGGGHGRDALTAAGAALGTSIAADQQHRRHPPRFRAVSEQRCRVERRWHTEERIVAWDVTYEYQGEIHQARMSEAPGDRIEVVVDVQPRN